MTSKRLWWLLPLACLAACSNGANHEKRYSSPTALADTTEVMPLDAPERKIIRSADFNCKVANVLTTVNGLEQIVHSAGGIIEESKMENTTDAAGKVYYKPDSLKQYHTYTTTATLTLRIPVAKLDSVVHSIPAMVMFIDSRTLRQSDVTADYTGNQLREGTGTKIYTAAKAVKLAKKAEDLVAVQQYEDENAARMIDNKVAHMQLLDQVSYSTLTIALYQAPQVYVQVVANPDYVTAIPFTLRLSQSLHNGWDILQDISIELLSIWPLWLIVTGIIVWYKKRRHRPIAKPATA